MPATNQEDIKSLHLDLNNYRTIPQPDERHAITALIAIDPDWFWPLMESLLDDGFEATENIIVLRLNNKLVVKEGNRRVAALKLIHGHIDKIEIPNDLADKIHALTPEWKRRNATVPCAIYESTEADIVDRLLARIHAKGEKSGRLKWTAVAKARFQRDQKAEQEPGLDLLEKYLQQGKNLSPQQAERWAGEFHLTILDELLPKLATHLNLRSPSELSSQYPAKNKRLLDQIIYDIGISQLGFKDLRTGIASWGAKYNLSPSSASAAQQSVAGNTSASATTTSSNRQPTMNAAASATTSARSAAIASNDPRSVRKTLKQFKILGNGREKIKTLLDEIQGLKLEEHPHAFCFLLRSMFELSAKAYCADHKKSGGPSPHKTDGTDKHLADILREVTKHMTGNGTDTQRQKILFGAMAELGKKDGILSVTSFNQLIHNSSFSILPNDISTLFGNIFPLLREMNS